MTITGTDENDELTKLRIRLNKLTPPEIAAAVAEYIQEEPSSMISIYLLDKYFVNAKTPDYAEAQRLATLMLKANPDNGRLRKLKKQLDGLKNSQLQAMLPVVSSTDINGKSISTSQVKGKIGVISTWATWNFPSTDIQRKLRKLQKQYPQELSLISICIDFMLYSPCKGTINFRNGNKRNERKTKFPLVFRSILCNFAPRNYQGVPSVGG